VARLHEGHACPGDSTKRPQLAQTPTSTSSPSAFGFPCPTLLSLRFYSFILFILSTRAFRQLADLVCEKCRAFVAEEVPCPNGQIVIFSLEADFDEVLTAGATKGCRTRCRSAPKTLAPTVRHKRATTRVQAQGHIVDAVKEGVELRPQPRRMLLVADASHEKVCLDFKLQSLGVRLTPLRKGFAQVLGSLLDRMRLGEILLKRPNHLILGAPGSDGGLRYAVRAEHCTGTTEQKPLSSRMGLTIRARPGTQLVTQNANGQTETPSSARVARAESHQAGCPKPALTKRVTSYAYGHSFATSLFADR
jgi:hypothetical protein